VCMGVVAGQALCACAAGYYKSGYTQYGPPTCIAFQQNNDFVVGPWSSCGSDAVSCGQTTLQSRIVSCGDYSNYPGKAGFACAPVVCNALGQHAHHYYYLACCTAISLDPDYELCEDTSPLSTVRFCPVTPCGGMYCARSLGLH
jgi:hypothetical protein